EVADKVKDHKRKHDSDDDEDDDDDEERSAGSNQGRSTKRRRTFDSAAGWSPKPPPKDDDQSSKKPRESEASASKQHPPLTSTGWQITDIREAGVDSSMHISDPESEHSEQSSDDILMQDEGNETQIWRTLTMLTFPRCRPLREHNWANAYATTFKVPEENKLQRNTYDIALSISKLKAARYLDFGLEELFPSLWVESERKYDISAVYGITHWWFRRKQSDRRCEFSV
ncbi:hypothetical protein Tco_0141155, partial [Tanacetum coccineum]